MISWGSGRAAVRSRRETLSLAPPERNCIKEKAIVLYNLSHRMHYSRFKETNVKEDGRGRGFRSTRNGRSNRGTLGKHGCHTGLVNLISRLLSWT